MYILNKIVGGCLNPLVVGMALMLGSLVLFGRDKCTNGKAINDAMKSK